jgi:hypothetical protein
MPRPGAPELGLDPASGQVDGDADLLAVRVQGRRDREVLQLGVVVLGELVALWSMRWVK